MTMGQYRPICIVLSLGMLAFGLYLIYDASSNPLPGGTLALLGGSFFLSLGAFGAFFSWRRTDRRREISAVGHGVGGPRSSWRLRPPVRRGRMS